MNSQRQQFLSLIGQTSPEPMLLDIESAEGVYLYDSSGERYYDLISGICVSGIGHGNEKVKTAIKDQLERHQHVMVYGEFIQSPQVALAKSLIKVLPESLNNVYFVNSGSEAIEGAMKLAKRFTGRLEIIAAKNAYHGSTHGAMSLMSDPTFNQSFRPLVPGIRFIEFNNEHSLTNITENTAAVVIEVIQGEGGIHVIDDSFIKALRKRCDEVGCLLIFDEIQSGMGRTGKLFAFEHFKVIPDVLCVAKAFGGGMPLGAFISSREIMSVFHSNPVRGHITTFGGHPVSCAAAHAALHVLLNDISMEEVLQKEKQFRGLLVHDKIKAVRGKGLMLAIDFRDSSFAMHVMKQCLKNNVIIDWFLFDDNSLRIAPPLIIEMSEIDEVCGRILKSIDEVS
mgnify:CR=1 FL=1